jgi:DNA-binding XRE family transcriptional regulator
LTSILYCVTIINDKINIVKYQFYERRYKLLKDNLRKYREDKNMTQEQLEELSGISQSMISALETGRIPNPTLATLKALAEQLDITLDELTRE